jgi:hypothetical protein
MPAPKGQEKNVLVVGESADLPRRAALEHLLDRGDHCRGEGGERVPGVAGGHGVEILDCEQAEPHGLVQAQAPPSRFGRQDARTDGKRVMPPNRELDRTATSGVRPALAAGAAPAEAQRAGSRCGREPSVQVARGARAPYQSRSGSKSTVSSSFRPSFSYNLRRSTRSFCCIRYARLPASSAMSCGTHTTPSSSPTIMSPGRT